MFYLASIKFWQFRLFEQLQLSLQSGTNIICGENSSGKTSILESLWILSRGRSFRTTQLQTLHKDNCSLTAISATFCYYEQDVVLGWEHQSGTTKLKLNSEKVSSQKVITDQCPCILISPEQHRWLLHQPQNRRKILDWGLYYLKPTFRSQWQMYKKILAQRNYALMHNLPNSQIQIWDEHLATVGEKVTQWRTELTEQIAIEFNKIVTILLPKLTNKVSCNLYSGWNKSELLRDCLKQNIDSDKKAGFTKLGAHRADLRLKINNHLWDQQLSRGEQKLFACCLYLALANFFNKKKSIKPILMIDDLVSELDSINRQKLLDYLSHYNGQLIITMLNTNGVDTNHLYPKFLELLCK